MTMATVTQITKAASTAGRIKAASEDAEREGILREALIDYLIGREVDGDRAEELTAEIIDNLDELEELT